LRNLTRRSRTGLLITTAVGSALAATVAFAQDNGNQLEEVVVTATRQADTVNRVPLAVTAQTQRNLDQQGVRTVRDLESLVPSLSTTQSLASGASQFSIRGVGFLGNNPAGAAPVGFYLDDTPLQKRNVGGGVATSNGTPLPPLFDLERVEVLRGPQGTLFGGGSEGGTIRYIQPEPSLTTFSEYARVQYSTPKKGDDSYEGGVAVGGPIIQDKLGFRASVFARNTGGFIDRIDPLTGQEWAHNSGGEGKIRMMRGALAWAPTENSKITFDYFSSVDKSEDISTTYNLPLTGQVIQPTLCFNANNTPAGASGFDANGLGVNTSARLGPVGALPTTPVSRTRSSMNPVARGDAACAARAAAGDVTYTMPGYTYGPFNLDRYDNYSSIDKSPSKTNLQIASLTFDYDFGSMSMKAITSYIDDQTKTVTEQTGPIQTGSSGGARYDDPFIGRVVVAPSGTPAWNPVYGPTSHGVAGHFVSNNRRYGLTQEVRFSSNGGEAQRFSWVAGVYYSNIRGKAGYDNYQPLEFWAQRLFGVNTIQRFGVPGIETAPGLFNNYDKKRQRLKDVEIAGFAEGNFWIIPDKLRATAGIRVSRVSFEYEQSFEGPVTSVGPTNTGVSSTGVAFNVPSAENGGYNAGSTAESPVTPKFGLQYQITDNDMIYVSAAKGFRAGGVNSQVSYGICQLGLDRFGYLPNDLPQEYKSDSVWSYEAGTKLRLFDGRAQFNAAVYRIDWKNPQYTTPPPQCGLVTTFNAPSARSQGVELEGQARVFRGLTLNGSFGYTDSKYTADLVFNGKATPANNFTVSNLVLVIDGQPIPVPRYSFSVGARYEFEVTPDARLYLRGDYRYSSSVKPAPFPASAFTLDTGTDASGVANFRLGVDYKDFDVNVFVNNAFDRDKGARGGGRSNCLDADCNAFQGYNPNRTLNTGYPREIGLQIAYRH